MWSYTILQIDINISMNYKTIQINSIWRKTSPPSDEYVQFNTDKQTITLGVSRYTGIHDNSDIKKKKKVM